MNLIRTPHLRLSYNLRGGSASLSAK